MAVNKMIIVIGFVILALIFGAVMVGIAAKVFPETFGFACNFLKPLTDITLFVVEKPFANIFPGCN